MDTSAQLAQRVDRDPAAAARDAAIAAADAAARSDWVAAGRAHAVRGRALRMLGEMSLAERALNEAIAVAQRAARSAADPAGRSDASELEADARLALAGVLSAAGHHDDAFAQLDAATPLASASLGRRIDAQRGALLRDAGRYDEALASYDAALPGLREHGPAGSLARALANVAGIRVHVGDLAGAAAAYEEAAGLFRSEGSEFVALNVISDLGCVAAHLGDLPRALRLFDEAAEGMAALGHDASTPILARADALLLAGLTADARDDGAEAARRLGAAGGGLSEARALLIVAQAARLEGDTEAALAAADAAAAAFERGGAAGWARTARLEAFRTRVDTERAGVTDVHEIERLAEQFAAAGDARGELGASCLSAELAASNGDLATARRMLRRAEQLDAAAPSGATSIAVQRTAAEVLLAGDQLSDAGRALDRALGIAWAHTVTGVVTAERRTLGPTAARMAAAEHDAAAALGWLEREREIRYRRASTDHDDADLFAQLRTVAADLRSAEREGRPTHALRHEHAQLERELHTTRLRRSRPGEAGRATLDAAEVRMAIGDAAAVSIASSAGTTFALVLDDGGTRRVDLGPTRTIAEGAANAVRALRGLAGSAGSPGPVLDARGRAFAAAVETLRGALTPALALDVPHVVLALPAELHALPWAAVMGGRSFTIVPSLTSWAAAAARRRPVGPRVAIVAGPRLEHADDEVDAIRAVHPHAEVLTGSGATCAAAIAALAEHDVVHVVAHGRFRSDAPEWSSIELADGPLHVSELESLERVPSTLVIATCESAATTRRHAAQVEGIAHTLLGLGARTVVASIGALPDTAATIGAMGSLHRGLASGIGAADALAAAGADPLDPTAASLVTLGVGDR